MYFLTINIGVFYGSLGFFVDIKMILIEKTLISFMTKSKTHPHNSTRSSHLSIKKLEIASLKEYGND